MSNKKRILAIACSAVLAASVTCAFAGCGSSNSSGTDNKTNSGTTTDEQNKNTGNTGDIGSTEDTTVKANDGTVITSKEVTVYMPSPTDLDDDIKAGFEAKYGITVNLWTGTTGEITAKLAGEESNPLADVVVLASWSDGLSMKNDGKLLSYQAANYDKMSDGMLDSDYTLYGTSASAVGVLYTKSAFPNGLSADWADFGTSAYSKYAMAIPNPQKSGACKDFIAGFSTGVTNGDSIMASWINNGLKNGGGNKNALSALKSGTYDILIAGVDYNAYSDIQAGEEIGFYYPAGGTVINPRPAMIMKTAPHQDTAKLFMDYLLSDEAQTMVANYYLIPGRKDIACNSNRTQTSEIPTYTTDWTAMMAIADAKAKWLVDGISAGSATV